MRKLHLFTMRKRGKPAPCSIRFRFPHFRGAADTEGVALSFSAVPVASSVRLERLSSGGTYADDPSVSLLPSSTGADISGLTNGADYTFRLHYQIHSEDYYSKPITVRAGAYLEATPSKMNDNYNDATFQCLYSGWYYGAMDSFALQFSLPSGMPDIASAYLVLTPIPGVLCFGYFPRSSKSVFEFK